MIKLYCSAGVIRNTLTHPVYFDLALLGYNFDVYGNRVVFYYVAHFSVESVRIFENGTGRFFQPLGMSSAVISPAGLIDYSNIFPIRGDASPLHGYAGGAIKKVIFMFFLKNA